MIRINYRIATRQFEYVDVTIEEQSVTGLCLTLDKLREEMPNFYRGYEDLDVAREAIQREVQNASVAAVQEGLGATVLETTRNPVVPGPEAEVTPAWDRPPEIPAAPANTSTDVDPDF